MIATKYGVQSTKPRTKVPDYLIYEIMDGQPIHYKGYRDVMLGSKKFSEIMGSSALQSLIVTYLVVLLGNLLKGSKYRMLTSEVGIHLDKRNNLAGDVLIFDKERMPIESIGEHFANVPPKIAIEVDILADPSDIDPTTYVFNKTQKLLDFGVEKVIWITTKAKKVTVATAHTDWQTMDWNREIEVLDGITFNVGEYLTSEGSPFA
ncbi:Uma2 family endonuclease [Salmonirosea aquatica]|uniref:Uma2 family endonuclease n=1 Tax=Salmonirosea aquatica TaxID=2654236 RepID=A0A7C9FD25_9BACT|nr:Uma2 family endonuclease [Cytophagaceae bacterium SJW1-29]